MNKDQVKGRIEEVNGNVKEIAGKVLGNKGMEQMGRNKVIGGKVQAGYGDLKKAIKDASHDKLSKGQP